MMPCRSPLGASGRSSGLSRYDSKPNLSTSPVMISRPSLDEGRPGSLLCLGKRGKATARRGGGQRLLRMTREGRARVEKPTAQLFGRWRAGAGEIWALHRGGLGDALGEDLALDVHLGGHGDPVGVRQHGMLRPEGIGGTLVRRGRGGARGVSFRVNTERVEIHERVRTWAPIADGARTLSWMSCTGCLPRCVTAALAPGRPFLMMSYGSLITGISSAGIIVPEAILLLPSTACTSALPLFAFAPRGSLSPARRRLDANLAPP